MRKPSREAKLCALAAELAGILYAITECEADRRYILGVMMAGSFTWKRSPDHDLAADAAAMLMKPETADEREYREEAEAERARAFN